MSLRQVATALAVVASLAGTCGPAWADSVTVSAAIGVGDGTVTLTRSVAAAGGDASFTVTFQGRVAGRGWTYDGTLSGTGATWGYIGGIAEPPYLSMTSADGSVTGWCGGSSATGSEAGATLDMEFGCVLARSGGTPWEADLNAVVERVASLSSEETWSGRYAQAAVATPAASVGDGPTYGEVQLGDSTSNGAIAYGPLRFSGQVAIGSVLYRGDLVSGVSSYVQSSDIPPLTVSGASVTGTCSGSPDDTLSNVTMAYDFTCSLAAGPAPAVTVTLRGAFTIGAGACSYRDCWRDDAGYFTAG